MAFLQGKTPISFLQELCTKRGITPQYDLIANEGAVHEPTFVFKVVAGEFVGTGKGASKKKAKHNAAQSILNQMMGVGDGQSLVVDSTLADQNGSAPASLDNGEGDAGNPVGELQEMTQKRLWPPPIYDYSNEQGPPHAREFICNVRLVNLQERGVGKSKKVAKRNAAVNMIQLLKQGAVQPEAPVEGLEQEYDPDNIPLPDRDLQAAYSSMKNLQLNTLTPQASQQISQFYHDLKTHTSNSLQLLQRQPLNLDGQNYIQMLQDVAKEQKFEVTYVDIPEPSLTGECQCLVQLSTLPVAVCQGLAASKSEARGRSALNALQYLKIMTKAPKKA